MLALVASLSLDNGKDEPIKITGAGEVQELIGGIQQEGIFLGNPDADVTVKVLNDLQCPSCADFQLNAIAPLISGPVRSGDLRLEYHHYSLGDHPSGAAYFGATAAGRQGYEWNFIELFFINQDAANGVVTQPLLDGAAGAIAVDGFDQEQWHQDFNSKSVKDEVNRDANLTAQLQLTAHPAVIVEGPAKSVTLEDTPSLDQIEQAIAQARGSSS